MASQNFYKNKNIAIIGGSFGIGEELCRQLAKEGANLAIIARSKDAIEDLSNQLPGNHFSISCDISKKDDLDKLSKILFEKWSKIDLAVFCVGTYKPMNLDDFDLKTAKGIIDINFTSFFDLIDNLLPKFKESKISHLAVISSVAGYFGMPNSLAYGSSKAGLSNLTESLHYELKKYNTKVQLINPGFVKTRLTDQNDFTMPGIISTDKAAQKIILGLKSNKFEISTPFIFTLFMKILSILPYKLRFFLFKNAK